MRRSRTTVRALVLTAVTALAAVIVTGCGIGRDGTDEMTPDEAYTKLRADFDAVVQAIAPGVEGQVFGEPMRDLPCGGFTGTERSSVYSGLDGALGKSDWDGDLAAAVERVRPVAEERGYEVRVREGPTAIDLVTPDDSTSMSFGLSLVLTPQGALSLVGDSPCVANPDA